jgi:hypothetical protein
VEPASQQQIDEARAALARLIGTVTEVRITLLDAQGNEVWETWMPAQAGQTITYAVPTEKDFTVST